MSKRRANDGENSRSGVNRSVGQLAAKDKVLAFVLPPKPAVGNDRPQIIGRRSSAHSAMWIVPPSPSSCSPH